VPDRRHGGWHGIHRRPTCRCCALLAAKDGGHGNTTAGTVAYRQGETVQTGALGEMFRQIIADNRAGGRRKLEQR
jgi:hypothetical protein